MSRCVTVFLFVVFILSVDVLFSQEKAQEAEPKKTQKHKNTKTNKKGRNKRKSNKKKLPSIQLEEEIDEEFISDAEALKTKAKKQITKAEILIKSQEYEKAIEMLQSVYSDLTANRIGMESYFGQLAFNPDSLLLRVAEAYYMNDQYENAKSELTGYLAIKDDPMEPREYFLQASIDYKMQDFADAADSYTQILALPKLTDSIKFYSHFYRGISNYQLEYYQDAYDDFFICARLKSKRFEPYYNMGRCLFREVSKMEEMQRAIKTLTKAIERNAEHVPSIFLRARAYERLKKYKEALAGFQRCVDLRPDYADAVYKKGIIMYRLKKNKVTLKICDQMFEAVKLGSGEALMFQQDFCE